MLCIVTTAISFDAPSPVQATHLTLPLLRHCLGSLTYHMAVSGYPPMASKYMGIKMQPAKTVGSRGGVAKDMAQYCRDKRSIRDIYTECQTLRSFWNKKDPMHTCRQIYSNYGIDNYSFIAVCSEVAYLCFSPPQLSDQAPPGSLRNTQNTSRHPADRRKEIQLCLQTIIVPSQRTGMLFTPLPAMHHIVCGLTYLFP